ncbi:MAG: hypothetical protein KDD22_07780, partial [Bdellovibrionales bacterium]|nr:hypothetical protein [Bdellovibrionales bacterium]
MRELLAAYQKYLNQRLPTLGFSLESPKKLAFAIQDLSNHYQTDEPTPWKNSATEAAYLSYFLPLNLLRLNAVCEIYRTQAPELLEDLEESPKVLDFGSGLGTTEWSLTQFLNLKPDFYFQEISSIAISAHQKLRESLLKSMQVNSKANWNLAREKYHLGIFQTSLNETTDLPKELLKCDQLLLIEAATHQKARPLMEVRGRLIEGGYHLWAP